MPKGSIYRQIERKLGEKLPSNLEKILIETGFDTKSAIKLINSDSIHSIEEYINSNTNLLKDTPYENTIPFKLKPGHKALILSLPVVISQEKVKIKRKDDNKNYVINKKSVGENDNGLSDIRNSSEPVNIGNIVPHEQQHTNERTNEENLKKLLLKKIVNFGIKNSFDLVVEESNIFDFEKIGDKIKCKIQCLVCDAKYTCFYNTYWNVSNFEKHLKQHFDKDVQFIEEVVIDDFENNHENNQNVLNSRVMIYKNNETQQMLDETLNED